MTAPVLAGEIVIRSIGGREIWKGVAATTREALEKAYLSRAYLSRADLSGANLSRANLSRANLSRANLSRAYLSRADLSGANLSRADLSGANLSGANLSGANLSRANLSRANLSRADLSRANLSLIRDDFRAVLDAAPNEALGLRAALRAGNVNGSAYEGECACLVGTIANVRRCNYRSLGALAPDVDRPAERWFLAVKPGDNRRNNQVVAITLGWLDEWLGEKGVKIPKRPKSIGEVARAMATMTPAQRKSVVALVLSAKGGAT